MAKAPTTPQVPILSLPSQDARSHRYEVDENPAFSPPSNTNMFNIFDSSEIYNKHPRKYDSLNVGGDDSSVKSGGSGQLVPAAKIRSKSCAVAPSNDDFQKLLSDHKNHPAMGTKKEGLKPDTDGPKRRISVAVMQSHGTTKPSADPGVQSPFHAYSKTDDDVGGLSKMFRAAFGTGVSQKPNVPGYLPEEEEAKKPDFPSVPTISDDTTPDFVPVTVVPEPRRLFGFGPQYQPPAETVMVPKDQAKTLSPAAGGSLLDKVKLAGITATDSAAGGRQRKFGSSILKPPSGEEMNTWAPFST